LVKTLTEDKHANARREAACTLGIIGPPAASATPALTAALGDKNGFVRVAVAAALWQVAQDPRGIPLLIEALEDPAIVGTRIAADTLAELGAASQPALPALRRALQNPAACAQVAAARALWRLARDAQGVPQLIAALKDESPEVRQDAEAALRLIQQESQPAPASIAAALQEASATAAATVAASAKGQPLVFETEDWTGPAAAIVKDKDTPDKWKLASADARWTHNTVLVSPIIRQDRATPEEGAPVLHTHITGIPNGSYDVNVAHSRPLEVSHDAGQTWSKLDDGDTAVGKAVVSDGTYDLWVDDRYAAPASIGGSYYDTVSFTPVGQRLSGPVAGWAKERVADHLDRGLTALRTPPPDSAAAPRVYLSWRLLPDDPPGVAFDVLRQDATGAPQKLNPAPITRTTDFVDASAPPDAECRYTVVLAGQAKDRVRSPAAVVPAGLPPRPYTSIKLQGDYAVQKLGLGDLDGDGRLDVVIKQPDENIDPYYTYWYRSPATHKLEAYRADGTFLWRYDLGWGIELGVWFSPFIVYDLDGDGRAEVICKASEGDPRNAEGKVVAGPEYVVVLDGATGQVRCRADWPSRDGFTGESAHNLAARNQLGIAYLDGKTPCLLVERGTYSLQKIAAFQLRENRLETLWTWDNGPDGRLYYAQGAHSLHAADVDSDGRDEVIVGSSVLDDNGVPLWSTGFGHPDCCFAGDLDPLRPGLEIFYNIEPGRKENGFCLVEAATGKVIWGLKEQSYHMGNGMTADIDPAHPGSECWAAEDPKSGAFKGAAPRWLYSAQGELLAQGDQVPPFGLAAAYWDGDPQREIIRGGQVRDYQGGVHFTGVSGTVMAVADLTGDWREEIVTALPGELRFYQTTVPAVWREVTLWADPIYRLDVAGVSSGYSGIPSTRFCLADAHASASLVGPPDGLTPNAENACAVLVTAPLKEDLAGTLTFSASNAAVVAPAPVPVKVAAGKTERIAFALRLAAAPSPVAAQPMVTVSAVLTLDSGEALTASAAMPVQDLPLSTALLAQAEDFTEQSGGEVRIRTDKAGASGKAFSHWDNQGHRLSWRLEVPTAGAYHLVIRYACGSESLRGLLVDGKPLPGAAQVVFPPSGGLGGSVGDWAHLAVRGKDGQPAVLTLASGAHTITMENVNGRALNLDYLALLPTP
jgi:rhamnogalacturonan endolyase